MCQAPRLVWTSLLSWFNSELRASRQPSRRGAISEKLGPISRASMCLRWKEELYGVGLGSSGEEEPEPVPRDGW